jgi:two-component system phosphate regulon sensor histidine kinase PhoR
VGKLKESEYNLPQISSNDELEELYHHISQLTLTIENDIKALDHLSKVRTQFLANVSHELKTPIFAIKGFVETLLDGAIDDSEVNQIFLKKIANQSDRLENLFTDLIMISKIESKELSLNLSSFELNEILLWLKDTFEVDAEKKGLKLVVPDTADLMVYGDKIRLLSVFSNLVKNAIDYTEKGKITLIVKKRNENVNIKVIDNGPGIPQKYQSRIFERFFRVDEARSRELGGTGLGLSIVKHIVEAHHSTINIRSEIGQGTEFSFSLRSKS